MSGKIFPSLVVFTASAAAFAAVELVPVPIDRTYLPAGFDDNDVSQVVIAGTMPDTCHKLGPVGVHVDRVNKVLTVHQRAYKFPGICTRVFIPYMSVVNVGILEAASYAVTDRTSGKRLGAISIDPAKTPGQDDHLYAPVADATVESANGRRTLVLTGHFTDPCTTVKEVLVNVSEDVLVVQPIAERSPRPPHNCGNTRIPFTHRSPVPTLAAGNYLLHVRSMSGQALNKIVDLP